MADAKITISAENKATAAIKDAEKSLKSFADKASDTADRLKDIGKKMSLYLTGPIVALGGASIKLASDLNETKNKIGVIFGDSAADIEEWSKGSIKSMGLASQTALDSVALFGDMATGMGIATDEAKDMAINLTQLSGDLASFKNIRQDVAQTALNSVFTGETESLKQLGVVMTQANLSSFALSEGITKNISDMSQAELVNLRYAFVLDATKNSTGDFANTSDGAANQMRIFQETLKELGAEFGENLLPTFNRVIAVVIDGIQWFGSLDEGTQNFIITVAALAAALGPLSLIVGQVIVVVKALGTALIYVSENPIVLILAAIALLITAAHEIITNWEEVKRGWIYIWDQIRDYFSEIWQGIMAIAKGAIDAIVGWIDAAIAKIKTLLNLVKNNLQSAAIGMVPGGTFLKSYVQSKAQGGFVQPVYAANGFAPRGRDTVPAMLSPGELVLNAAQQRNLAGNMGQSITVIVNGDVTGQDLIDRVGDALARKMFNHSAVV